jgi:Pectate lyase superfamily protein
MKPTAARVTVAIVLWAVAAAACAGALPGDGAILNVRDFGARGDGVADDTAPIRRAIVAAQVDQGQGFWPARIVYFPAGTYRVTDTLAKRDAAGRWLSSMSLVGESRERVRIKLDDGAPGFGRAHQPKAIVYTSSSLLAGEPRAGGKDYEGLGEGNDAYGNTIEDLTIDAGRGNPGAIGIDYLASNVGAIRRVRLVAGAGSGRTGLSMERQWPGPLLVTDLIIDGYARGIAVRHREYGVTLDNVRLRGQTEFALGNDGNSIAMRDIAIEIATGVAIRNQSAEGLIVADRVAVTLGSARARWIDNAGYLTFKHVSVAAPVGPAGQGAIAAAASGAYFGNTRLKDFDAGWRLEAAPVPARWDPPPARWVSVARYGARPDSGEDATAAIRAAMASGAEVVYFPSGRYAISDAIDVPAQVRRIEGLHSSITIERRASAFSREAGMLRVGSGGEPLAIDRLTLDNGNRGPQVGIEHSGARTLVVRDHVGFGVLAVDRKAGGGALFLDNVSVGPLRLAGPQGVWARQLNTEGPGIRIANEGAPLSVLGLKSEQNATLVDNQAGAQSEIVGGLIYLVNVPSPQRPAFVNRQGARLVAAYVESSYIAGATYAEHAVEIGAEGAMKIVAAERLPLRGRARIVPGLVLPGSAEARP